MLDQVLIGPLDLDELAGVALIVVRMDCEHAAAFSMLTPHPGRCMFLRQRQTPGKPVANAELSRL